MNTCSISECDGRVVGWGWCGKHYQRWKKHGDPTKVMAHRHYVKPPTPEPRKFWEKVAVGDSDECWEWTGCRMPRGYGQFNVWREGRFRKIYAHRLSYEYVHGAIPEGAVVHHTCNNPPCVNPRHLTVMEVFEHALIGDSPPARNAKKTHCPRGHEYNAENTHFWRNGHRHCRVCDRERRRAKHLARGTARTRRKPA